MSSQKGPLFGFACLEGVCRNSRGMVSVWSREGGCPCCRHCCILDFSVCVGSDSAPEAEERSSPWQAGVTRAKASTALVVLGYRGAPRLTRPANSGGEEHIPPLQVPGELGKGQHRDRKALAGTCGFSSAGKTLFEWIQKACAPNIYNRLLEETAGCDLGAFSPPLCLREIRNNARELDFLPGWSPPREGMKENGPQTADVP